jgi:hypothetical protein
MGLGTLQGFVSQLDDPCTVDDQPWFFTIYDCDGRVSSIASPLWSYPRGLRTPRREIATRPLHSIDRGAQWPP